ncbi:MAG: biotin--[acetyl-CoA-carboxylase] ligase [Fibrobacter sp.]|nr:biotin--[acetyl-CoA-carboxylase] ligase [Fibrobacter sp.]
MPSHDYKHTFVGAVNFSISKFASLESTNLFLKTHLSQYPDFTVIITENQFGGRGRFDRKWQSKAGDSLTFSIKIPLKDIPGQNWSNITQIMALSASLLLEEFNLQPRIRWPNDLLINGTKICGILAEALTTDTSNWMVLGVGINVNDKPDNLKDLDRPATSLFIETGRTFQIDAVLQRLLYHFGRCFNQFIESGFNGLVSMISQRLYKPEETVQIIQGNESFEGRISGITEAGTVLIETNNGIIEVISGEITSRKDTIRRDQILSSPVF